MNQTRRRFLTIASAACLAAAAAPAHAFRWEGVALGARTQILLDHPDAPRIVRAAQAEITRLERIFSLYQPDSDLVRLNRIGVLKSPPAELLDCLTIVRHVFDVTDGRFDPTVQPIWQVLARAYEAGRPANPEDLTQARALVGFDRVRFDSDLISLHPGQALTLNGIAQGYIADRVAARMRALGVTDVLIDTGEIMALGRPPEAAGWPVRIDHTDRRLQMRNRALATSATLGTVLDAGGTLGHILRPQAGAEVPALQVSVSAPSAALADGLSTGLCLTANADQARTLLQRIKDARLESFIHLKTQT